jgi:hypothetical protein
MKERAFHAMDDHTCIIPGKILNFSDILFRYHILRQEYDALFHDDRTSFDQYMEIVNKRMHDVTNDTYMNVGKMN